MKTIKILLSGLFLIVSLTNCSSSDEDEVSVIDDGRKMRQLTITQVDETVSRSETDFIQDSKKEFSKRNHLLKHQSLQDRRIVVMIIILYLHILQLILSILVHLVV